MSSTRGQIDNLERSLEKGRSRLLALASLLLIAFASASVALSFGGADVLSALHVTPLAARIGVLALAVCFVVLVWEKERHFRVLADQVTSDRILTAAFRNRLEVLESLLDVSDRLNSPLTVTEVVKLLLGSAQELSGAIGGNIALFDPDAPEPRMTESHLPAEDPATMPETREVVIPLEHDGHLVARLTLLIPERDLESDLLALEVLDRFAGQAAATLARTMAVERERESFTFLEASHVVKSRFLSTVSHELRTPLTSIIGFTGTLDHHWTRLSEDEKLESVRAVHRQSHKLWRQVERILEAARVELEGISVKPVEHDITRSIRTSLQSFLDTDSDRLSIDIPLDPIVVEIDPVILEQCMWNLVDNSLRHTDGKVTISLDEGPDVINVRVHDEGTGIEPGDLERALDPLTRPQEDPRGGTGLGLHVIQTLMSDHGGTVSFDRERTGMAASLNFPRWSRSRKAPRYIRGGRDRRPNGAGKALSS